LWLIDKEMKERLKKEYSSVFHISGFCFAVNNEEISLTFNNDYKIYHWEKNQYKGYYTNEYDEYQFTQPEYNLTEEKRKEQHKLNIFDDIRGIYLLNDKFLFVNIQTQDPEKRKRLYEVFDIINIETKEIITGVENKIYNIVGSSRDLLISTMPGIYIPEGSPMPPKDFYDPDKNPKLKFYRFHEDKLEKSIAQ